MLSEDGSGRGAALVAAVAARQKKKTLATWIGNRTDCTYNRNGNR